MNYEFMSSILKLVGYAGAAFVLVSTIGLGIVSDKLDKIKDGKIDALVVGKDELLQSVNMYQRQIEEKQNQIDDLKRKATNASRGISKFKEFNGNLRDVRPGFNMVHMGGSYESEVFPELQSLAENSKWEELEALCSEVLSKSKDWTTPYFFRGLARLNLSKFDTAKIDLDTVLEREGDNFEYAQAKDWLDSASRALNNN